MAIPTHSIQGASSPHFGCTPDWCRQSCDKARRWACRSHTCTWSCWPRAVPPSPGTGSPLQTTFKTPFNPRSLNINSSFNLLKMGILYTIYHIGYNEKKKHNAQIFKKFQCWEWIWGYVVASHWTWVQITHTQDSKKNAGTERHNHTLPNTTIILT